MYVPEKFKLNKFREVRIPKKREYFMTGRYIADNAIYGGDSENAQVAGENKVETMQALVDAAMESKTDAE